MADHVFRFGKYNGQALRDVPTDYVEWLARDTTDKLKLWTSELERREAAEAATLPMTLAIVEAGYKALAKQYHPDTGGDTRTFQELAGAREVLRTALKELA